MNMLSLKELIAKMLGMMTVSTATLTANANWTATNASFTSCTRAQCGNVFAFNPQLKTTSAMSAGTNYVLGTFKNTGTFYYAVASCGYGAIDISGVGQLSIRPIANISNGTNLYIRIVKVGGGS